LYTILEALTVLTAGQIRYNAGNFRRRDTTYCHDNTTLSFTGLSGLFGKRKEEGEQDWVFRCKVVNSTFCLRREMILAPP
jgi:hypothetical protein